jgi:O-antigen ligase
MSLLFFLPVLSGLWSQQEEQWTDIVRIKLPLFFMPLAFASPFGFSKRDWGKLIILFIVFVTTGTLWSTAIYLSTINAVNENYLHSQIIITPLLNDHVRFSWMVCMAILLALWQFSGKKEKENKISWVWLITTIWLIIFLHILAARTGLFSFYLIILLASLWFILKKLKPFYGVLLFALFLALPVAAYYILPTFHNRVKYFLYDLPYFSKRHYKTGMNDAVRIISMKAGWDVMNKNPAAGVGFGDVLTETKKWYAANYPQMTESDKIYPGNEWLMYGAGCGWPGFLLFSIIMTIPITLKRMKHQWLWYMLNVTAAFIFAFDIGLEIQFGVFVYSFMVLWWWKWLQ